jgi:hypothetical protein
MPRRTSSLPAIYAEKVARLASADQDRPQVLVGLHVNPDAVADITPDEDLAASHAIAKHVSSRAMHDDLPIVHRVADAVLRVAEDLQARAVHEHRHILSGRALDLDPQAFATDAGPDVALSVHVDELDRLDAVSEAASDCLVHEFVVDASAVNRGRVTMIVTCGSTCA